MYAPHAHVTWYEMLSSRYDCGYWGGIIMPPGGIAPPDGIGIEPPEGIGPAPPEGMGNALPDGIGNALPEGAGIEPAGMEGMAPPIDVAIAVEVKVQRGERSMW